jgi:uncharacterized protein YjiK
VRDCYSRPDYRFYLRDLSSVEIHAATGNMLLLSDESGAIAEYADTGELLAVMLLWRGRHGLSTDVPQAEGVTFDEKSVLYLVSEPNLFYRLERKPP